MPVGGAGFTLLLGVVLGAVVIGLVVVAVFVVRHNPSGNTSTSNANAALNLACSEDVDCVSYCGTDPCFQPICGVTTIGAAGSCTCRSTCGPLAPTTNTSGNANTNATVNTNITTNTSGNANVTMNTNAAKNTNTNASGTSNSNTNVTVNLNLNVNTNAPANANKNTNADTTSGAYPY